jgi:hypothetical protein
MKLISFCLLIGTQLSSVSATVTGIAVSIQDKVIQNSKAAALGYLTSMLNDLELDPFDLPFEQKITRIRLSNIQVHPSDL